MRWGWRGGEKVVSRLKGEGGRDERVRGEGNLSTTSTAMYSTSGMSSTIRFGRTFK